VVRVSPTGSQDTEGLSLVLFDEVAEAAAMEGAKAPLDNVAALEVETELEMTRGRLQALVEEFETSQEEMRASNE
jgi:two-component system CheB/CheR fusion protein